MHSEVLHIVDVSRSCISYFLKRYSHRHSLELAGLLRQAHIKIKFLFVK